MNNHSGGRVGQVVFGEVANLAIVEGGLVVAVPDDADRRPEQQDGKQRRHDWAQRFSVLHDFSPVRHPALRRGCSLGYYVLTRSCPEISLLHPR